MTFITKVKVGMMLKVMLISHAGKASSNPVLKNGCKQTGIDIQLMKDGMLFNNLLFFTTFPLHALKSCRGRFSTLGSRNRVKLTSPGVLSTLSRCPIQYCDSKPFPSLDLQGEDLPPIITRVNTIP